MAINLDRTKFFLNVTLFDKNVTLLLTNVIPPLKYSITKKIHIVIWFVLSMSGLYLKSTSIQIYLEEFGIDLQFAIK